MPAAQFAFDGVHVFLTYPQCPLEREQLRDFLREKLPECEYVIGRERHSDGAYHLHAYVHFGGRKRFVDGRYFDVDGYHPNIQKPRSVRDVIAYCRKDDTDALVSANVLRGDGKPTWAGILDNATNREEFLALARERFPSAFVLQLERLLFFCEWRFGSEETPYTGRGRLEFREPETLKNWVDTNLIPVR